MWYITVRGYGTPWERVGVVNGRLCRQCKVLVIIIGRGHMVDGWLSW